MSTNRFEFKDGALASLSARVTELERQMKEIQQDRQATVWRIGWLALASQLFVLVAVMAGGK